ncbi:MAG: phage integrase SAM-like domain-containing protein [Bacteroidota bacterium]
MLKIKRITYKLFYVHFNKHEKKPIVIQAYQEGKRRQFKTNIFIKPEYWDKKRETIKHTHPCWKRYMDTIHEQLLSMQSYDDELFNKKGYCMLRDLNGWKDGNASGMQSFTQFYANELAKERHRAAPCYRRTLELLTEFRKEIFFEELDYKLARHFDQYLRSLGTRNLNTIHKDHKNVRKYIKLAARYGYINYDQCGYTHFQAPKCEPKRNFLSASELERIEQYKFAPSERHTLERVRDAFLWCLYTSMRYAEMAKLCMAQLEDTPNGYVVTYKQKGDRTVIKPVFELFPTETGKRSKPELLILKYKDESRLKGRPDKPLFGNLSNSYMNKLLKDVAKRGEGL